MGPELVELTVEIVRLVDNYFPGVVACEFVDAADRRHTLIDKAPMFGIDVPDASNKYPFHGAVRCTVLSRWTDDQGRELLRISTAEPDAVESTEELQEFVVSKSQVKRIPRGHREPNSQGYMIWVDDE